MSKVDAFEAVDGKTAIVEETATTQTLVSLVFQPASETPMRCKATASREQSSILAIIPS